MRLEIEKLIEFLKEEQAKGVEEVVIKGTLLSVSKFNTVLMTSEEQM